MTLVDKSHYYIDFSNNKSLTDEEKKSLERIQEVYLPIERADLLNEFRIEGKITNDEYETMTGLPYRFGD